MCLLKNNSMDMCHGPVFKKIMIYTLPIIATGILQLLFNAADLIVVGRYCGSITIAAVSATGPLINLITNLFLGLSVGCGVTVAHALGSHDDNVVHKTVHTAIPIAVICGIILTFVGIFGADYFLRLMGTPENVHSLSATYIKIYFLGITATIVYNFGASILRAAGDTKGPLIFLSAAGLINIALNIFFVAVFNMSVAGVALATAISQTVSAVLIILSLMKRTDACKLILKNFSIQMRQLFKILRIGIPAGIQSSLFSLSNVIIQSSVNSFGDIVMSGSGAAANIEGFVWIAINAYSQTAINFVGQNVGAKKYDRVRKILWICILCVSVTGIVLGSTAYLFARPLLGIYITDSTEAIGYGIIRMTFICLTYFLCGLMDVTTGAIRGMGSSLTPMIISIAGICGIRILWIYTIFRMPQYHSLESLFISYPISWIITFAVQLTVFMIIYTKQARRAKQSAKAVLAQV